MSSLHDLILLPLTQFFKGLSPGDKSVLYVLLGATAVLGFFLGRRRSDSKRVFRPFGALRFPSFQHSGEQRVARVLLSHFTAPDYHLMNHVTLHMGDGTTEIDHILVSRFGVFVIETKDYNGWIFANAADATWTHVHFRRKYVLQNPIRQNFRHVLAVKSLLEFVPPEAIRSVVVFSGNPEFKTEIPTGVVAIGQLADYLAHQTTAVMSPNRMQLCVGRLETARLAISGETDVEHVRNLARRFGDDTA